MVGMVRRHMEHMGYGYPTLECIEHQGCDRQSFRTRARNVCGSDVAAPGLPDIQPAEDPHQQIAKRDRAQQIRGEDDDEYAVVQGCVSLQKQKTSAAQLRRLPKSPGRQRPCEPSAVPIRLIEGRFVPPPNRETNSRSDTSVCG